MTASLRGVRCRQPATARVSTTIPFKDAALEEGENIPEGLSAVRCYWARVIDAQTKIHSRDGGTFIYGRLVHSFMEDWYIH
jgi:hypothetical protein